MGDWLLYIAVKIIGFFLCLFPVNFALWLGRRIGDFVFDIGNIKRKSIAYANLKAAFSKTKPPCELLKITRRSFRNLGQVFIEVLRFPRVNKEYIDKYITVEAMEKIDRILEKGKGLIFLTGHFGNWELSSLVAALRGYPIQVLAREQKHPRLNQLLNKYRESKGCKVISKGIETRGIIKGLKENKIMGMLIDQDGGKQGVFVDFFGRPASTPSGAIRFARHTEAVLIPALMIREKGPRHRVVVDEPIEFRQSGNLEADTRDCLQKFARVLESYISRYPEQWLWAHKRWKSTPFRSVLVLSDGKKGHLNQSLAVARAVEQANKERTGGNAGCESKVVEVKFRSGFTRGLLAFCSLFAGSRCQGCMHCLRYCLTRDSYQQLMASYADIVVSTGSSLAGVNLFLSKENNAKSIVVMNPGILSTKRFSLSIIPRHDRPGLQKNILVTSGAPNLINREFITLAAEALGRELKLSGRALKIGVLIGGDTEDYFLAPEAAAQIIDRLIDFAEAEDGELLVTTSRRTPRDVDSIVKEKLSRLDRCPLLVIANEKNIDGAVGGILGLAEIVVVSGESISMVSEAASSGKRVIVVKPQKRQGRGSLRHERFLRTLASGGYIILVDPLKIGSTLKAACRNRPPVKVLKDMDAVFEAVKKVL